MFRPLGIGEMFDRAISIYTRNFAVFTLIMLTLFVPFSVLQFFATPERSHPLVRAIDLIGNPALVAALLLLLVGAPFVNNAIAVGVAAVYFGKQPGYTASFAVVLPRWPVVLGVQVAAFLVIVAVYFVGAIAAAIVVALGVALLKVTAVLSVVAFAFAAILALALILSMVALALGCSFAQYSASLEHAGVFDAISSAAARLFDRLELRKTLLMALVYFGVEVGVITISMSASGVTLFIFHNASALIAVNAAVGSVLASFVAILLAVYYYDVRTRREGLDLETDLQRLPA